MSKTLIVPSFNSALVGRDSAGPICPLLTKRHANRVALDPAILELEAFDIRVAANIPHSS
jgi:hypothetical protein